MPRRTAKANRAVLEAWEREQKLVSEGRGTRNWTPEQQAAILDPERGKAYDDNGRAFEGQHMKSVETYPEYQGNSQNIQFLTRDEHYEAHKGNWQNPTNWYYDPTTKQFDEFVEDELLPCKIIELSHPIVSIDIGNMDATESVENQAAKQQHSNVGSLSTKTLQPIVTAKSVSEPTAKLHTTQAEERKLFNVTKNAFNTIKEFSDNHPVITTVAKAVGIGLITYSTDKAVRSISKTSQGGFGNHSILHNKTLQSMVENTVTAAKDFDFKKAVSYLKELGYTVAKDIDLSDIDRQKILQNIIISGKISKETVCACLEKNINLHKNQSTFTGAVLKWMEDLAYVRDKL